MNKYPKKICSNGIFNGKSRGIINNLSLDPYSWKQIGYGLDISDSWISNFYLDAMGEFGDSLTIEATSDYLKNLFVSKLSGSLKQNRINVEPFFINLHNNMKFLCYKLELVAPNGIQ